MKNYTKALLLTLASCLLLFSPKNAEACHFGGADIYVTYSGPGIDGCTGTTIYQYDVTVKVYYACQTCWTNGGTGGILVNYRSATAGPLAGGNLTCNPVKPDADTIHSLCPAFADSNSCKKGSTSPSAVKNFPAFQVREYVGTVVLTSAQPDWTFSYTTGNRNNSNVVGDSGNGFHVETMVNNQVRYNNSSPRFTRNPLQYICVNQPNVYLTGPADLNGDSLRVLNQLPMDGINSYLTYKPGFSTSDPIGSAASNPYFMNPITGAASFTPTATDNPTLTFRIEEYDRATGIMTGFSMRDVQISVLPCTAPPPGIDSLKPTLTINDGSLVKLDNGQKAIVTCPGNKLNFSLNSATNNPANLLDMYADLSLAPASTFNVVGKGTNNVTGTFDWTPTTADIGYHAITITSADSSCNLSQPIVLRTVTVIAIQVVGGLDAGKDLATCELNPPGRQLYVRGFANALLRIKWTDINGGPAQFINSDTIYNPISNATRTTNYIVTSPDLKGNCKSSDTVSVYLDTTNTLDIFPNTRNFVLCRPDYLQLDAYITGRGPINNLNCGTGTPIPCVNQDTLETYGTPTFGSGFSFDTLGTNTPIFKNRNAITGKFQFLITKEELREYGLRSSVISSLFFETSRNTASTYEYSNFTISMKCVDVSVRELSKNDGFIQGTVPVYIAPGNIQLPDGWHRFKFDNPYSWDTSKNLLIEFCWSNNPTPAGPCIPGSGEPPVIRYMPTTNHATLFLTSLTPTASNCATKNDPNIEAYFTRPVFKFEYCQASTQPFTYKWTPGEYLSDSTIKQPLAYVNKSASYTMETTGESGCLLRDTIDIFVPQHDFYALPKDTAICFGETAPLEIRNGTYYKWYEYEDGQYKSAHQSLSCDLCANPVAKPKKTTHYKIQVGDEVFCFDTIDAYITVKSLPNVRILTPDTMVKAGQSLQLMVNGARLYNWSPVASLNNPNISYPIATPTESTMYVVAGIGSNGCRSFDTVRVGVDYRSNLIVPTAFSPNGDGKNDVFRVSNMTVQRYVEFRVFNRWGQEVYNGTDGRKGWDGMWKGVPQEIGNYQYLIRVAYPDGYVETYKGDVTLVR